MGLEVCSSVLKLARSNIILVPIWEGYQMPSSGPRKYKQQNFLDQ